MMMPCQPGPDREELPDILGFSLEKALVVLEAAGAGEYIILKASLPRESGWSYDNSSRILRCRRNEKGIVEITVGKPL